MNRFATTVGCAIVIVLSSLHGVSTVSAGIVNYTNVFGDHVEFTNLVETSTSAGPKYGQPVADADTLVSQGIGFLAQSVAGQVVLVDGRLQLVITAEPGFVFDQINVQTLGSYFGFSDDSLVMANSFTTVQLNGDFYSDGEIYSDAGAGATDWGGDYTIGFPETNQVFLTVNTQLLATSGLMDASFIEASSIRISVNAFQSIPESNALWLIAFGLIAASSRRRRH